MFKQVFFQILHGEGYTKGKYLHCYIAYSIHRLICPMKKKNPPKKCRLVTKKTTQCNRSPQNQTVGMCMCVSVYVKERKNAICAQKKRELVVSENRTESDAEKKKKGRTTKLKGGK